MLETNEHIHYFIQLPIPSKAAIIAFTKNPEYSKLLTIGLMVYIRPFNLFVGYICYFASFDYFLILCLYVFDLFFTFKTGFHYVALLILLSQLPVSLRAVITGVH
jgi:hypothetical protein